METVSLYSRLGLLFVMDLTSNLDLFSVGITVLASLILGTVIFFNGRKSITNKTFLFFVIMVTVWGSLNYFSYHVTSPEIGLWMLRLVIFFALWQAFFLLQFFLVFPESTHVFSRFYTFFLFPFTFITSFFTLTPLVFKRVLEFAPNGAITKIENGPAIPIFGLLSVGLVVAGLVVLIRKIILMKEKETRTPLLLILFGTSITFALVILFNFVMPAFFSNAQYIPFGSVFFFPFILCTSYAIIKHRLLNIKVVSTEILVFALAVPILLEVVGAGSLILRVYKGFMFLLVLSVGILLIRSVRKEVEQRERLELITEQLKKANLRLEELDRQKTDFLSIAAHQLRTPLSILNGYIELLKDGAYGKVSKDTVQILDNMDESNGHLVKLIDEFLNITRIEQGRTKYDFKKQDVNTIITSAVEELSDRAKQKGLKLVWHKSTEAVEATVDDEKIRHVVYNFIDNAIKYTPRGAVVIKVVPDNSGYIVTVCDHGFGFEKVDEANFFQKFYRGENVKGTNVTGTGLGLYVCRMFIEGHGGRVWAHSPGLKKGSEFGFWIPEIGVSPVRQPLESAVETR